MISPVYINIATDALVRNRSRNDFPHTSKCIAIGLNKNRVLTYGINKNKTHPLFRDYVMNMKLTTHAEISLVLELTRRRLMPDLTDIIIVRGSSKFLDSYPCSLCMGHLTEEILYQCEKKVRLWYYKDNLWKKEVF